MKQLHFFVCVYIVHLHNIQCWEVPLGTDGECLVQGHYYHFGDRVLAKLKTFT